MYKVTLVLTRKLVKRKSIWYYLYSSIKRQGITYHLERDYDAISKFCFFKLFQLILTFIKRREKK